MDMFQLLLKLLRFSWFSMLFLPLALTWSIALWKLLARPGRAVAEDGALGFDLLVAAGGTQLTFLAEAISFETDAKIVEYRVHMGTDLLVIVTALLFLTALLVRLFGYDSYGRLTLFFGIRVPDYIGFTTVVAVFAGNVFVEQLYPFLERNLFS
jgi:hypothetical protein